MHVEEAHLRNCLWANVVIAVILRTRFQTTTARHAPRVSVTFLHVFLVHAWSRAKVVSSIKVNPGVNAFKVIEHLRAINYQVANVRKLLHGLELDWLLEVVDKRRARLPRASIDNHRADATDLLATVRLPNWGRG